MRLFTPAVWDVVGDIAVSAIMTLVFGGMAWSFLAAFQGPAIWLLVFIYPLAIVMIYAVPVVAVLYGLVKMRLGLVLGPVLLVAGLVAFAGYYVRASDSAVRALATQSIEAASRPYDVLMMEGGNTFCNEACIHVIASSSYTVALKNNSSRNWQLFRRAQGDVCVAEAQKQVALMFAQVGHADMCAVRSEVPDIVNGLLFRTRHLGRNSEAAGLPSAFAGSVFEIMERSEGKDRVLGRRFEGWIHWPMPSTVQIFSGLSEQRIDIGPAINQAEFLAVARRASSGR